MKNAGVILAGLLIFGAIFSAEEGGRAYAKTAAVFAGEKSLKKTVTPMLLKKQKTPTITFVTLPAFTDGHKSKLFPDVVIPATQAPLPPLRVAQTRNAIVTLTIQGRHRSFVGRNHNNGRTYTVTGDFSNTFQRNILRNWQWKIGAVLETPDPNSSGFIRDTTTYPLVDIPGATLSVYTFSITNIINHSFAGETLSVSLLPRFAAQVEVYATFPATPYPITRLVKILSPIKEHKNRRATGSVVVDIPQKFVAGSTITFYAQYSQDPDMLRNQNDEFTPDCTNSPRTSQLLAAGFYLLSNKNNFVPQTASPTESDSVITKAAEYDSLLQQGRAARIDTPRCGVGWEFVLTPENVANKNGAGESYKWIRFAATRRDRLGSSLDPLSGDYITSQPMQINHRTRHGTVTLMITNESRGGVSLSVSIITMPTDANNRPGGGRFARYRWFAGSITLSVTSQPVYFWTNESQSSVYMNNEQLVAEAIYVDDLGYQRPYAVSITADVHRVDRPTEATLEVFVNKQQRAIEVSVSIISISDPNDNSDQRYSTDGEILGYEWLLGDDLLTSSIYPTNPPFLWTKRSQRLAIANNLSLVVRVRYRDGLGYESIVTSSPVRPRFIVPAPIVRIDGAPSFIEPVAPNGNGSGRTYTVNIDGLGDIQNVTYQWQAYQVTHDAATIFIASDMNIPNATLSTYTFQITDFPLTRVSDDLGGTLLLRTSPQLRAYVEYENNNGFKFSLTTALKHHVNRSPTGVVSLILPAQFINGATISLMPLVSYDPDGERAARFPDCKDLLAGDSNASAGFLNFHHLHLQNFSYLFSHNNDFSVNNLTEEYIRLKDASPPRAFLRQHDNRAPTDCNTFNIFVITPENLKRGGVLYDWMKFAYAQNDRLIHYGYKSSILPSDVRLPAVAPYNIIASQPVQINQPTEGRFSVVIAKAPSGESVVNIVTLVSLSDANNRSGEGEVVSLIWRSETGVFYSTLSAPFESQMTLNEAAAAAANSNPFLYLDSIYKDGLGFISTITTKVGTQNAASLSVAVIRGPDNFTEPVAPNGGGEGRTYTVDIRGLFGAQNITYQWQLQKIEDGAGAFYKISPENITGATLSTYTFQIEDLPLSNENDNSGGILPYRNTPQLRVSVKYENAAGQRFAITTAFKTHVNRIPDGTVDLILPTQFINGATITLLQTISYDPDGESPIFPDCQDFENNNSGMSDDYLNLYYRQFQNYAYLFSHNNDFQSNDLTEEYIRLRDEAPTRARLATGVNGLGCDAFNTFIITPESLKQGGELYEWMRFGYAQTDRLIHYGYDGGYVEGLFPQIRSKSPYNIVASQPVKINQPTEGSLTASLVRTPAVRTPVGKLVVNIVTLSPLSDPNNRPGEGGIVSFRWRYSDTDASRFFAKTADRITLDDKTAAVVNDNNNTFLYLDFMYKDGLGFTSIITTKVSTRNLPTLSVDWVRGPDSFTNPVAPDGDGAGRTYQVDVSELAGIARNVKLQWQMYQTRNFPTDDRITNELGFINIEGAISSRYTFNIEDASVANLFEFFGISGTLNYRVTPQLRVIIEYDNLDGELVRITTAPHVHINRPPRGKVGMFVSNPFVNGTTLILFPVMQYDPDGLPPTPGDCNQLAGERPELRKSLYRNFQIYASMFSHTNDFQSDNLTEEHLRLSAENRVVVHDDEREHAFCDNFSTFVITPENLTRGGELYEWVRFTYAQNDRLSHYSYDTSSNALAFIPGPAKPYNIVGSEGLQINRQTQGEIDISLMTLGVNDWRLDVTVISPITDENNRPGEGGFIDYEWHVTGATVVSGINTRYRLSVEEYNQTTSLNITMFATYEDGLGFLSTLTAAFFLAFSTQGTVYINGADSFTEPAGEDGTLGAGRTYTVDVSRLTDRDGIGSFIYQWQILSLRSVRDSPAVREFIDISGATSSVYTFQPADTVRDNIVFREIGENFTYDITPMLRVRAIHTDGIGDKATLFSEIRTHVNRIPTGTVDLTLPDKFVNGATIFLRPTISYEPDGERIPMVCQEPGYSAHSIYGFFNEFFYLYSDADDFSTDNLTEERYRLRDATPRRAEVHTPQSCDTYNTFVITPESVKSAGRRYEWLRFIYAQNDRLFASSMTSFNGFPSRASGIPYNIIASRGVRINQPTEGEITLIILNNDVTGTSLTVSVIAALRDANNRPGEGRVVGYNWKYGDFFLATTATPDFFWSAEDKNDEALLQYLSSREDLYDLLSVQIVYEDGLGFVGTVAIGVADNLLFGGYISIEGTQSGTRGFTNPGADIGRTFTIDINNLINNGGIETIQYQWQILSIRTDRGGNTSGEFVDIPTATLQTYQFDINDMPIDSLNYTGLVFRNRPELRARIVHTDRGGFKITLTTEIPDSYRYAHYNRPPRGTVSVRAPDGFYNGATIYLQKEITSDPDGIRDNEFACDGVYRGLHQRYSRFYYVNSHNNDFATVNLTDEYETAARTSGKNILKPIESDCNRATVFVMTPDIVRQNGGNGMYDYIRFGYGENDRLYQFSYPLSAVSARNNGIFRVPYNLVASEGILVNQPTEGVVEVSMNVQSGEIEVSMTVVTISDANDSPTTADGEILRYEWTLGDRVLTSNIRPDNPAFLWTNESQNFAFDNNLRLVAKVWYRDGLGYVSAVASTMGFTPPNNIIPGEAVIRGPESFTEPVAPSGNGEGRTYTVDIRGLGDIQNVTYQWQIYRSRIIDPVIRPALGNGFTDISAATLAAYTFRIEDLPIANFLALFRDTRELNYRVTPQLRAVVEYEQADGSVTQITTAAHVHVNRPPRGTVNLILPDKFVNGATITLLPTISYDPDGERPSFIDCNEFLIDPAPKIENIYRMFQNFANMFSHSNDFQADNLTEEYFRLKGESRVSVHYDRIQPVVDCDKFNTFVITPQNITSGGVLYDWIRFGYAQNDRLVDYSYEDVFNDGFLYLSLPTPPYNIVASRGVQINQPTEGEIDISLVTLGVGGWRFDVTVISPLTDENNRPGEGEFIDYEWHVPGAPVVSDRNDRYRFSVEEYDRLAASRVKITVFATYKDGLGYVATLSASSGVVDFDDPATGHGTAPINGPASFTAPINEGGDGQIYTINTVGLRDANGIDTLTYQWQIGRRSIANENRGGVLVTITTYTWRDIVDENFPTYKFDSREVFSLPNKYQYTPHLRARVDILDEDGYRATVTSNILTHQNRPPTGTVTITAPEGFVRGATIYLHHTINDPDGENSIGGSCDSLGVQSYLEENRFYYLLSDANDFTVSHLTEEFAAYNDRDQESGTNRLTQHNAELAGALACSNISLIILSGNFIGNEKYEWVRFGYGAADAFFPHAYPPLSPSDSKYTLTPVAGTPYNLVASEGISLNKPTSHDMSVRILSMSDAGWQITLITSSITDENNRPGDGVVSHLGWFLGDDTAILHDVPGNTNSLFWTAESRALVVSPTTQLKAQLRYTDGLGYITSITVALPNDEISAGDITVVGNASFAEGEQYTVSLNVTDGNGVGDISYQWWQSLDGGTVFTTITNATLSVYTLSTLDFIGADGANHPPLIQISAVHTDISGYPHAFMATIAYVDSLATGNITINAAGYTVDSVITISINTVTDANGIAKTIYEWQAATSTVFTNPISIGSDSSYTLTAGFAPQDSLRLIAQVIDDFGVMAAFTSAVLPLNGATEGGLTLSLLGGVIATGATITIINSVSDINGGDFTDYAWLIGTLSLSNPNTDKSKYILATEVMLPLSSGETLRAEGRYEDSLGFVTTLTGLITSDPSFNQPSIGSVVINGSESFAVGEQYTANISAITDANGLGSFAYQWFGSLDGGTVFTTITNATLSVYTLSTADFVGADAPNHALILQVSAIHTDGFGNAQGGFIASIVYTDTLATGNIIINADTYKADSVITISINTITDANGIAKTIYEWQSGIGTEFTNIISVGADDRWTLTAGFAPQDSLRLIAQVVDDFGVTVAFTSAVLPINEETRGVIRLSLIGGVIATGATITIINGVSDINGGDFTDYAWLIGALSLSNPNADKSKYILATEVMLPLSSGETLRAEGRYEDSLGFVTILTGLITNDPNFNQPSVGNVVIRGKSSFAEGEQYTADTAGIIDENGLGSFAYQWWWSLDGGATYTTITNATLSVYTLSVADFVGANVPNNAPILQVSVIHTDGFGNAQGGFIASIVYTDTLATGNIIINADTYKADSVITISINTIADANGIANTTYQWQSGIGVEFANPISVGADNRWTIMAGFAPQDSLRLIAQVVDDFGVTATFTSAVLPLNEETRGAIRLSLVGGVIATGATITIINGVSDINGGDFTNYAWLIGTLSLSNPNTDKSKYILATEAMLPLSSGETLWAEGRYEDSLGFVTTLTGLITSDPNFNQPSVGNIVIEGNSSFAVGEQYTANISAITDANGLGSFAYQWFRSLDGGTVFTTITNATLSVYTLSAMDFVGADASNNAPLLQASVIHTDGFGNAQGGFIASIVYTDTAATGNIIINADTYKADSVITISINTIADANGIANTTYQWQSGVGDFANAISVGAGDRWTITAGFAPQDSLRLVAQVIDDFGVTVAFTSAVLPINGATEGGLTLSLLGGVIATGATIMVINGVSDINGGDFTDYAWFVNALSLSNPNADKSKYILAAEAMLPLSSGETLRVEVRYEDSLGFVTILTAMIANSPDFNEPSGGGVGINGNTSFAEGEQYTATLSITDENGLGSFVYQWFRSLDGGATYTTITNATLSVYTLSTADFAGTDAPNNAPILQVSVIHTDAALNVQGGFVASIVYTDTLATGNIIINADTYKADSIITISINTITDANGIANTIYQWQSGVGDFANVISVGADNRWTLTAGFAPQDSLRLIAQVIDDFGVTVAFTSAVLPINEETRGAIRLSLVGGVIATGATITVINGVSDINGGDFTDYDWFIGTTSLNNPDIKKYELTDGVLLSLSSGETLRAEGRYEDSLGFVTTLTGLITSDPNFNQPSVGNIVINGNASFAEGEQYTADTASITDGNGVGSFAYQWWQSLDGGATYTTIANATLSVYTLSTVDFADADAPNNAPILQVSVIHTDAALNVQGGFIASIVYSDAAVTGNININADTYTVDSVITIGINTITDANGIANTIYQWQSGVGDFANVISVGADDRWTITAGFAPQDSLRLIAQVVDDFGVTTMLTSAVLPINEKTRGVIRLSLVGGVIATGATITIINGVSDINGGDFTNYAWLIGTLSLSNPNADKSKYILAAEVMLPLSSGETLRAEGRYEDSLGFVTILTATITNSPDFNEPSGGGIGINGNTSFAEGEQYTATLSITDENGLGSFVYQWFRSLDGGATYTTITNATLSVYILSATDFADADASNNAPILQVSVIHTDAALNVQGGFIASIVYTDTLATGNIIINADTYTAGSVITISINTITDANGIANTIYQWQSGIGTEFANTISVGAGDRWTLTASFAPQDSLRLIAQVVDDFGVTTMLTSAVLPINEKTRGVIRLSLVGGVIATGATITIINGVSDINGGDFTNYAWFVNALLLSNPNADKSKYILAAEAMLPLSSGETLRAEGRYEDSLGFVTTLTGLITSDPNFNQPSIGSVIINGNASFAVGEQYTANISAITDANGLGSFAYQWFGSLDDGTVFTTITNATLSVYILSAADFADADASNNAPILQVSVVHTDGFGNVQGGFIASIVYMDTAATGNITINADTYTADSVITISINTITDANSIANTIYQWQSGVGDFANIISVGADDRWTLTTGFAPQDSLRLIVQVVDDFGVTATFTSAVLPINEETRGMIRLSLVGGVIATGATITIINGVSDINGGGLTGYAWLVGTTSLNNPNGEKYEVSDGVLLSLSSGGTLRAEGRYEDSLGFVTILTGLITSDPNFNQPSVGNIIIRGKSSFAEGEQYTADTAGITDGNGVGSFAYQWFRSLDSGATYTTIANATLSVYTLSTMDFADADASNNAPILQVSVIHTDAALNVQGGFIASIVYSDAAATGNININADTYTVDSVITIRIKTIADANGIANTTYQWQLGVGNFANIISVGADNRWTITAGFAPQDSLRLIAQMVDDFGVTVVFTSAVLPLNEATEGGLTLSLLGGVIAIGATITIINGVSDINGGDFTDYAWFVGTLSLSNSNTDKSKYILATEAMLPLSSGETLRAEGRYEDSLGFVTILTAMITNSPDFNEPSGGGIGINGNTSFAESEQYTATLSITDENGLGSFAYQWWRSLDGGATYTTITNATLSVYTLSAADFAGADASSNAPILRVSVIHTDGFGNAQGGFIASIVYTDTLATGNITINTDTYKADSVITISINTITDANGIANTTYQWQSGVGDFANVISVGADDRWTLTAGFAPQDSLRLIAQVVDDFGVTVAFTSAVLPINEETRGMIRLSLIGGVIATGATITIINGVSDINGGGLTGYAWLVGTTSLNNPNGEKYEVSDGVLLSLSSGGTLRAEGRYEDSLGFVTTLTGLITSDPNFNQPSVGNIIIRGKSSFAEGEQYTADTAGIIDGNGVGSFAYQWFRSLDSGAIYTTITNATLSVYTLSTADFADADASNNAPILQVSVIHTDAALNVQGGFIASIVYSDAAATGNININADTYTVDSVITIRIKTIADANGIANTTYQWQLGVGNFANIISVGADNRWTITAGFAPQDSLRLIAQMVDDFGVTVVFTSAVLPLNEATEGGLTLSLLGGVIATGATITIINGVSDINGGDFTDYAWFVGTLALSNPNADKSKYILATEAMLPLSSGETLRAEGRYEDSLGFVTILTAMIANSPDFNEPSGGGIGINGNTSFAEGEQYTATLNITDENGLGSFAYQWWRSLDGGATYTTITNATLSVYTLSTADFAGADASNNAPLLQVSVIHTDAALNVQGGFVASIVYSDAAATGNVNISGNPSFVEGARYTANVSNITDDNGIGDFVYQWERSLDGGATFAIITNAVLQEYVLSTIDFANANIPVLWVSVQHTDAFGYVQGGFIAIIVSAPSSPIGGISIGVGGYAPGEQMRLLNNIRDTNGVGSLKDVRWQQRLRDGGDIDEIAGENGEVYTIDRAHWGMPDNYNELRVVAVHVDGIGDETNFASPWITINQPSILDAEIMVLGDGGAVAGNVLSVKIYNISDNNDNGSGGTIQYHWQSSAGQINGTRDSMYTIALTDSETISVRLTYIDELGFANIPIVLTNMVSLTGNVLEQKQLTEIGAVLSGAAAAAAIDAIDSHLANEYFRKANSGQNSGAYIEINGVAVESAVYLSKALANRTSDSQNADEPFAIDSLRLEYSGIDGAGAGWSSWASSKWSYLSGSSAVNDKTLKYDGREFDTYVGFDRQYGDIRAGFAVGKNRADINVDLRGDGLLNDNITREVNSLLPYIEWYPEEQTQFRLLAGYGIGDMEIKERGGCRGRLDVDWLMLAMRGSRKVVLSDRWDMEFNGNITGSRDNIKAGLCGGTTHLPGAEANNGEGVLGVQTGYTLPLVRNGHNGHFRLYSGIDSRLLFGDLSQQAVYDIAGGFVFSPPGAKMGLLFSVDGKTQIKNARHSRDSIGADLDIDYNRWAAAVSLQHTVSDDNWGMSYRWDIKRISEWGINTINYGVYVRQDVGKNDSSVSGGAFLSAEW